MKKLLSLTLCALVTLCTMNMPAYVIPSKSVGPAPMTPEQVAMDSMSNPRIAGHDDVNATIEISNADGRSATFLAPIINADNNRQGIQSDDVCALVDTRSTEFLALPAGIAARLKPTIGSGRYWVICSSGKLYANIGTKQSSSTGTPGFISYSNYLGTLYTSRGTGAMGSGKRLDLCNGTCETK